MKTSIKIATMLLMAGLMSGGINAYGQRPHNWGPGPGGGAGYGYGRGLGYDRDYGYRPGYRGLGPCGGVAGYGRGWGVGPGFQAGMGWGCPLNNLSDEQQEKIRDLGIEHYKAVSPLTGQVRINRARIDALMKEDDPDMNKIRDLIGENGKILTDISIRHAGHQAEIRKLLTDEQKIIFDRWTGRDRGFFRRGRNNSPGRGRPGRGYDWWYSGPGLDGPEDQPEDQP